jgi:hypothetical protein
MKYIKSEKNIKRNLYIYSVAYTVGRFEPRHLYNLWMEAAQTEVVIQGCRVFLSKWRFPWKTEILHSLLIFFFGAPKRIFCFVLYSIWV